MKLTDEEQRQLQELELALSREDPDLDRRLRGGRRLRMPAFALRSPSLSGFAAGASLLLAGIAVLFAVLAVSPAAAFAAYGMMFGGTWLMVAAPSTKRVCGRLLGHASKDAGRAEEPPRRQR